MRVNIIFLQEQLRQLHHVATDMSINNYKMLKNYYESKIEQYKNA